MNPIEKIILHFLQKNATPEELKEINEWNERSVPRNELSNYLKLWIWSAQLKDRKPQIGFDDTWQKIQSRRSLPKSNIIRLRQWIQYAAVILVLLNIGWWGARYFYTRNTIPDERRFQVSADQTANSVVTLPDSTLVYLRQGSSLSYGAQFKTDNREVSLEGEAYFKVTRDEDHPFIVRTTHAQIKVLGTCFNVSSEKGSSLFQAVLVEGKIELTTGRGEEYLLQPDQMIELEGKNVKITNVNTELYTAWKDGKVIFRDETLGEITRKLEQIYHVKFIYENPDLAREYRFSGTFHRETSIGEVITMLKLSIPMEVRRQERFPEPDRIYLK